MWFGYFTVQKKNEMLEKPLALSSINLVFKDNLVILLCNYKVKRPIYLCELWSDSLISLKISFKPYPSYKVIKFFFWQG
jgi:hypothetical protein